MPPRKGAASTWAPAPRSIHVLHVALDDVDPPVWRRIEVPSDVRLDVLHDILQSAMGWNDSHMHAFEAASRRFGTQSDEAGTIDQRTMSLAAVAGVGGASLRYWYDFGDDWWHTIGVDCVVPPTPGVQYPRCTDGARACPPEDCGGPLGYANLLAILADPAHREHDDTRDWAGPDFDPERFSADAATEAMQIVAGAQRLALTPVPSHRSKREPARASRSRRSVRRAVPWLVGQRSVAEDGLGVATVVLAADGEALAAAVELEERLSLVMALSAAHRKVPSGEAPPPSHLVGLPGLAPELRRAATGFAALRRIEVVSDAAVPHLGLALSSLVETLRGAAAASEQPLLPLDGIDIDGDAAIADAGDEVPVLDIVPDGTAVETAVVPLDDYASLRPAGGVRLAFPLQMRLPAQMPVVFLGARGTAAADLADRLGAVEPSMLAAVVPPDEDSGLLVLQCREGVAPLVLLPRDAAESVQDSILRARGAAVVAVADLRRSRPPRAVSSVFELAPEDGDLGVLRALPGRPGRGRKRRR